MSARVGGALLAALVLTAAGCDSGVKRIPVTGEVTLDGKPLKEGVLMFSPDQSKANTLRVGCTGPISGGRFTLTTTGIKDADNGKGAPVGWYKVTYTHPTERDDDPSAIKVAAKYRSEETTPISIELTDPPPAGGYKIELTSK